MTSSSFNTEQKIHFDSSGFDAAVAYLEEKNQETLKVLVESRGGRFAYSHFRWSNFESRETPEEFWVRTLGKILNVRDAIHDTSRVRDYILAQSQSEWLPDVLEYLPEGHRFDSTIHLNIGYDNISYAKDVALNLNNQSFHADPRESIYYLMHELAHSGYFSYHAAPNLSGPRTFAELAANVRFLTHLEGMGVLTPLKKRTEEDGLGDPDYLALLNPVETRRRLDAFLEKLSWLEKEPDSKVVKDDLNIYDELSRKPRRLWYVAGCEIARVIKSGRGRGKLRELVRAGGDEFFASYRSICAGSA